MNNHSLLALILATTAAGAVWSADAQDEEVFSGPLPGEPIVPFEVVAATGDERDTVVDYVTRFDGAPTVYCFIHQVTRASSRTIRALDEACAARADEGLEALFVMLGADQDQTERYGLQLPDILSLNSRVAISVDGQEGPGAWGLDREMVLTVTVVDENTTVASFPLLSTNETDVPRIMRAVDGLLVELDTLDDLRGAVLDLRSDLRALEAQVANLTVAVGVPSASSDMRGETRADEMGGEQRRPQPLQNPAPLETELRGILLPGLDDATVSARVRALRVRLLRSESDRAQFLKLLDTSPPAPKGTEYAQRLLGELGTELAPMDGDERR